MQSYGGLGYLPNIFSEKAETYSDTTRKMRQKRQDTPISVAHKDNMVYKFRMYEETKSKRAYES